jgi:CheY-like chemotaxis protein
VSPLHQSRAAAAGRPLAGVSVLIVDDAAAFRAALAAMARRLGATVETAETAEEGAARLAARRHDLAIVDIGLPDACGGALLADALDRGATAALLAVSAEAGPTAAPAADHFAAKPFDGVASFGRAAAAALGVGGLRVALPEAARNPAGAAILTAAARRFGRAADSGAAEAFADAALALENDAAREGLTRLAAGARALAAADAAPAAARLAALCALAAAA